MATKRLHQVIDRLAGFSADEQDQIAHALEKVLSQVPDPIETGRAPFMDLLLEVLHDAAAELTDWTDTYDDEAYATAAAADSSTSLESAPQTPLLDRLHDIETRLIQAARDMGIYTAAQATPTAETEPHAGSSDSRGPTFHDVVTQLRASPEGERALQTAEKVWSPDAPRLHISNDALDHMRTSYLRALLVEADKCGAELRQHEAAAAQSELRLRQMLAERRGEPLPTAIPPSVPNSVLDERAHFQRSATQLSADEENTFLEHLNATDRHRYMLRRSRAQAGDQVVVELFDCLEESALVLIPSATGISFQQQCSGILCHQNTLEGFVLPVPRPHMRGELIQHGDRVRRRAQRQGSPAHQPTLGTTLSKLDCGCCAPLSEIEALELDLTLLQCRAPLRVDYARLAESTEAWVWVVIDDSVPMSDFAPFVGKSAVLLYENCD